MSGLRGIAMGAASRVPPEIIERYRNGESLRELSEQTGFKMTAIFQAQRTGPKVPGRNSSPAQRRFATWEDHFWSLVQKTEGCWLWIGKAGFTDVRMPGVAGQPRRIMYGLTHKQPAPLDIFIAVSCDNTQCTRPDHFILLTNREMYKRRASTRNGRKACIFSKLSEADILLIRALAQSGERHMDIAIRFDIHPTTVYKIAKRRHYGGVTFPEDYGFSLGHCVICGQDIRCRTPTRRYEPVVKAEFEKIIRHRHFPDSLVPQRYFLLRNDVELRGRVL